MMTAESMLSKRPVLRFTVPLFFLLKLVSSHISCIVKFDFYCKTSIFLETEQDFAVVGSVHQEHTPDCSWQHDSAFEETIIANHRHYIAQVLLEGKD